MILRLVGLLSTYAVLADAWSKQDHVGKHVGPQFVRRESAAFASDTGTAFVDALGNAKIAPNPVDDSPAPGGGSDNANGQELPESSEGPADMSILEQTVTHELEPQNSSRGMMEEEDEAYRDDSDTEPDPVNYTEAEILDPGAELLLAQAEASEPMNSTDEDCYDSGDLVSSGAESSEALEDDEQAPRADNASSASSEADTWLADTGVTDTEVAYALESLEAGEADVSQESSAEEEEVGDIEDESRWWGRWAEREREEGRTQPQAEPDSPFHSAK